MQKGRAGIKHQSFIPFQVCPPSFSPNNFVKEEKQGAFLVSQTVLEYVSLRQSVTGQVPFLYPLQLSNGESFGA